MWCLAAVALAAAADREADDEVALASRISNELNSSKMTTRLALIALLCGACAGGSICGAGRAGAVVCTRRLAAPRWLLLRGGADELDEELEDDDGDDIDAEVDVDAAAADELPVGDGAESNPFLGGGAGGAGGLDELAQSLGDPDMLKEALKELQDPATQERVKAMMDDPEFQKSMQQYIEQITQDPQFEQLRKQTEQLLEQPGFLEEMSKAMGSIGGADGDALKGLMEGAAKAAEGDAESDE